MPTNVALIVGGPCKVTHKFATFRAKAGVKLEFAIESFDVPTDLYGLVDKRVKDQPVKVSFIPEGRWEDLPVLYPYASAELGSLITPVHLCGAIDTAANTIAVADTALLAGAPVSFGAETAMPGGITAITPHYLSANAAGLRTVHATQAAALAGTGAIDITSAGTGDISFVEQWPLVIHGRDGKRITLHNAAITKMPALRLQSTETLYGDMEFECFPKNGVSWETDNSIYTIDSAPFSDTTFDRTKILTQDYTLTWGAAPWAGLTTKSGIAIDFGLGLEAVEDDASGIITRRITSLTATAKAEPTGRSLAQLAAALKVQGTGATRGRSLTGDNLDLAGNGVFIRLYTAALLGGLANWETKSNRVGELTWQATRQGGTATPLFLLDTEAPE